MRTKRSLSSLDVAVIVSELNNELSDGWVDNLYSIDRGLLLKVRSRDGGLKHVVVEPGVRANLTSRIGSKGLSGRVQVFRRFLRNARIKAVNQFRFERILIFDLVRTSRRAHFIIELIPRGVAALIDDENRVLVSDRDIAVKDRVVRPGIKYSYPPTFPDPRGLSLNEWVGKLRDYDSLGKGLIKGLGFPPEVVNEVIEENLRKSRVSALSEEVISLIRDRLLGFIDEVIKNPKPVTIFCGGKPLSFHPFIPKRIPEGCEVKEYGSLNEAIDDYFTKLQLSEVQGESAESLRIKSTLDKALSDLESLRRRVKELSEVLNVFRLKYPFIEEVWGCVKEKVRIFGWDGVRECSISSYDPSKGTFTLLIEGKEITLRVNEDVKRQYVRLMKDLGVLRRKVKNAEESIRSLKERLRKAISEEEERMKLVKLVKKVEWFHQFHWLITSGGYLAIGGRDAQQNEKVISKYLGPEDIFVHASIHGGSAFVLKTEGRFPSDKDLREVAVMAASYSRGWNEGVGALDAFWVWGKQVSKSPPPGQYLPKGSFMIYGRKNVIKGVELRVSVGIRVFNGSYYEVVSGPEERLLNDEGVIAYMTLVPGSLKPSEVSKKFIRGLRRMRYEFLGLQESDIITRIPGSSDIIRFEVKD